MEAQGLKATLIAPWRCSWAERAVPNLEKGRFYWKKKTVKVVSHLKPHLLISLFSHPL